MRPVGPAFWLRWSWRDLRRRAPQVLAIAAIVTLGTGIYAGLGSTSVWRTASLDASFAELHAHDVEVSTVAGLPVAAPDLLAAVRDAGGRDLAAAEVRLVRTLPLRAGPGGRIPAAAVVVGVDLDSGAPVDQWHLTAGQTLTAVDASSSTVLLDEHFAHQHRLPPTGTLEIAGTAVRYTGTALEPEYLNTTVPVGTTLQGAETRAPVYAPIALVQRLTGLAGMADDAVVRLRPGAAPNAVATRLSTALARSLPGVAVTVTVRRDDPLTQALYAEVASEQRVFDVFALLVLAGAGFATFSLTRRAVEAQRRDIGIAMSLGVPPRRIATRPAVMAATIGALGVGLGLVAGWAIGAVVLGIIRVQLPLPVWRTPWQAGLFLQGAALGLAVPIAGSAYPVWRAVRVAPVDALLPPHLRSRRHRAVALLRRLHLPGSTLAQAPLRRIAIAPARSATTVVAIGFILAPLMAALATTDSATATVDAGTAFLAGASHDSVLVTLTGYEAGASPTVTAITGSPDVGASALGLSTGGTLVHGSQRVDVAIDMADLADPLAVPAPVATARPRTGGIVISSRAAADLGIGTGDQVQLRHPRAQGLGYRFVTTSLPVRAVVASPYRFVAYMDLRDEPVMGLRDIVNTVVVVPRPGVAVDALQQAVARLPGVASALPARSLAGTMKSILDLVANLFVVLQVVIGVLALLVAYNASTAGTDERSREHATMLAFGVPVGRVVAAAAQESLVLGLAGVGVGIGLGMAVLAWVLSTVFPAAVPDLAVIRATNTGSYLVTALIGTAAAVTAPVLVTRRLRRMNLPGTLRHVE